MTKSPTAKPPVPGKSVASTAPKSPVPRQPAAKKPRAKTSREAKTPAVSPELLIPHRKQGHPIKLVPRDPKAKGESLFQRALKDPMALRELLQDRPVWVDDIAAILLVSFGMVSLLTLLNNQSPTSMALSDVWADFISQIFGRLGALIFSLMLVACGALIVLNRVNIPIRLSWRRVLAIEIAYLALLAALHLIANDPEPRALARSGQGGGHIGWALGEIMSKLFGPGLSTLFYLGVMIAALMAVFGVRRAQLRLWAKALSKELDRLSEALKARAAFIATQGAQNANKLMTARREHAHVRPLSSEPGFAAPEPQPTPEISAPPALQPSLGMTRRAAQDDSVPLSRPLAATALRTPPGIEVATPPTPPPLTVQSAPQPAAAMQPPPLQRTEAPEKPAARKTSTQSQPKVKTPRLSPALSSAPEPAITDSAPEPEAVAVTPPPLTPIVTTSPPVIPERRTRHFTVEDFKEPRRLIPRDGLPPLNLLSDLELNKPTEDEVNGNARIIENTLLEFDIDVEVIDAKVGPTVTQYAVQPFREMKNEHGEVITQRVRVNKIAGLSNDLALALAAKRLRVQPYVPGHPYMGIEVPNRTPSVVALRPVMESEMFARAFIKPDADVPGGTRVVPLAVPLGRDVSGESVVIDLASMPHLLIAGTTGSGKSVCITAIITALVMNNLPDRLKLVLLDPKMVELMRFNGLPHLLGPVETDIERVVGVLRWATREMDRRYKLLEVAATRNIDVYNRSPNKTEHLPYIVLLVDEIGDLMLARPDEIERTVTRLAQMARAVGMHLVVATQRPSTDIITGLIKANFPARISFAVASGVDSRVILDTTGAETLVGRGDMLYLAPDAAVPRRVQGCFVSDDEIDTVVNYWKRWKTDQGGQGIPDEVAPWERAVTRREALSDMDSMLEETIDLVVREGEASTSLIQKSLAIPYPRAAQLMDLLGELGILGATKGDGRTREVTLKPGTDPYKKLMARYKRR